MKTTVNFLEAVRALQEGKCGEIESSRGILYKIYATGLLKAEGYRADGVNLKYNDFLGEWKLRDIKRKVVLEDVQWHKDELIVYPIHDTFDFTTLLDKPRMKVTLEWPDGNRT